MWIAGPRYEHPLLGKITPVYCSGSHAHKHPRVTRALDRKGRQWDISKWPIRGKLASFELRSAQQARVTIGKEPDPKRLLEALQRCRTALGGTPGCGAFLKYDGLNSSANALRQRLHVFFCANQACHLRWKRRFFSSKGIEQRPTSPGGARESETRLRLPPKAQRCPVCDSRFSFPKQISKIGGIHYTPPLIRLWCLNPKALDHSPRKRRELGLPAGSRKGLTFYYHRKRSMFVEIYTRPFKIGAPIVKCGAHGRMRVSTIRHQSQLHRVPKNIYIRLGSQLPVHHAVCRHYDQEVWISRDRKNQIRRSLPRPSRVPITKRTRLTRERIARRRRTLRGADGENGRETLS